MFATGFRFGSLSTLVVILTALATVTLSATVDASGPKPIARPHLGSPANDQGTIYWDAKTGQSLWVVYTWGSCRRVVYYKIDPAVPAGWGTAIRNGIATWNDPYQCSPNWIEATGSETVRLTIKTGTYACGTSFSVAMACRNLANSYIDQAWTIMLNPNVHAVGVAGKFDVQSIVANEMGHVSYAAHNPNWDDGVVQLNSCTWGTTSCTVTNDTVSGFTQYTVSCGNCGSRRVKLVGDSDLLTHVYGANCNPGPCGPVLQVIDLGLSPADRSAIDASLRPNADPSRYFVDVIQ